jgi:hypothetical protein
MGMMPLPVVQTAEERSLVRVTVAVYWHGLSGRCEVKATVKEFSQSRGVRRGGRGRFSGRGRGDGGTMDHHTGREREEMDEEDETAVVFSQSGGSGQGAISVAVVERRPW